MPPIQSKPDPASPRSVVRRSLVRLLLLSIVLLISSTSASAQASRSGQALFLKARGGLSSYLGDNNTVPFNTDAFTVAGKRPYSVGFELGYQFNDRWSAGLGMQFADYPIITRFYNDLNVDDHPTTRRTFQLLLRYLFNRRRLAPYLHFGYHLTFGDVTIFEVSRLQNGEPLNIQSHYIHGPLLGLGLDYAVNPRLSLFVEATAHVTLMDDSVDGRLPLGPPQPTNLRETNRFGTFDLLNAYNLGLVYRPWCGSSCSGSDGTIGSDRTTKDPERAGQSMIRFSKSLGDDLTTLSYHYAPRRFKAFFLGIEGGLVPRSIYVRYTYPDGQESLDKTHFTGSFLGLSARWFPLETRSSKIKPHLGFTAAIPAQAHLMAGIDYSLGTALRLGLEGRYAYCPTRRQEFHKGISYRMNRVCDYQYGVGFTMGYRVS
ncbi:MAG: outer membrane beta-barrel protein [Bacteroidetes bacterium]|nr:outer membrane beta-barrel protein [Bacteroidota bacterium]